VVAKAAVADFGSVDDTRCSWGPFGILGEGERFCTDETYFLRDIVYFLCLANDGESWVVFGIRHWAGVFM
jgi:hypothetical protein